MADSSASTARTERDGPVATVVLARPDVRNAFDERTIAELTAAFEALAGDASLRAVVLRGDGPAFCAGADVGWMRRAGTASLEDNESDARRLSTLFDRFAALPVPTLCLAHGAALGGGAGLVAAADIAIAEVGCRFGFTEVRLGIVPAVVSTYALAAIGARHARRYFATGEIFDAARAEAIGLVSEVVGKDQGLGRIEEIVASILAAGPSAVREAKRLAADDRDRGPGAKAELARLIARLRATPEAREGLAAFLEKRDPSWKRVPQRKPGAEA